MRIFGKPETGGHRRMGVLLARDESVEKAVERVMQMRKDLKVHL